MGLTSTCPEREAAFATDVVKTLSAEEPTLATVTVVTSAAERPAQRRVGGTHLTTTRTLISTAHCAAQTVLGQHPGSCLLRDTPPLWAPSSVVAGQCEDLGQRQE